MNPVDQTQLEALLNAYGHSPFGAEGYGPAFGNLPATSYMPPGGFTSSTFFGPQIYNPQHFRTGSGTLGSLFGLGLERYAGNLGMQYFPQHSNVADITQGRIFERGLERAGAMGQQMDEQRLARAIEAGFKAAIGYTTPQHAATANALAATVMPGFSQFGLSSYMPGGSAESFAKQMFVASQNMRDFTRTSYALGVPETDANAMTRRLMDFFSPIPGMIDPIQTRGMRLDDLGKMAGTLSSYGLVRTDVSQKDLRSAADELGYDLDKLTDTGRTRLTNITRTRNVGQQLQEYAELFGTLREIMGAPDAPIPRMVESLQQLTGGKFQQMQPGQMQQMLHRVKETARASNIAMDTMMETLIAASQQHQAMGGSGIGGAQMALSAYSATAAAQTAIQGPFEHRIAPGRMANLELARAQRGRVSDNARINAQAAMLSQEMLAGPGLTETERRDLADIQATARRGEFSLQGQNDLIRRFSQLGVDPNRARSAIQSDVGVQNWLDRNPQMDEAIRAGQDREVRASFEDAVQRRFASAMGTGSKDRLVQQLDQTAAASGMTNQQLLSKIGQAYFGTSQGSVSEMETWLQTQGVDTAGINLEELYGNLERSRGMQRRFKGLGVSNRQELAQMFGAPARAAQAAHRQRIRVATAGQTLLSDINAEMRGGALDRVMGAISGGATNLRDVSLAAFGFEPTEEIQKAIGEKWVTEMSSLQAELAQIQDDPSKQTRAAEIRQRMGDLTSSASEFAAGGSMSGMDRIRGTKKVLDILGQDVQDAAKTLTDTTADSSKRLQAAGVVTAAMDKLRSSGAYDEVMEQLAGSERQDFKFMTTILGADTTSMRSQLDLLKSSDLSAEERKRAEANILGEAAGTLGYGVQALRGQTGQLQRRFKSRTKGQRRTLRERADLMNEYIEARQAYLSASGPDRAEQLGRLREISHDVYNNMYRIDPKTGEAIPDEDFIRQMTLLNKDTYGNADAAAAYADKLRSFFDTAFDDAEYIIDTGRVTDNNAEAMDAISRQMRETGELEAIDTSSITARRRLSVLKRLDLAEGGAGEGELAPDELKAWQSIGEIQDILKARSPSGELSGVQARSAGRLIRTMIQNRRLYDDSGRLRDDARDLIMARFSDPRTGELVDSDSALNLINALSEAGTLAGMDDKERLQYIKDTFDRDKQTATKAVAEGGGGGDTAGQFQLIDGDTGEPLKEVIVRRVAGNGGRAAAQTQNRR